MAVTLIHIKQRCDVPMARSKNLFPCDRRCRSCVACILRDEYGHERHAVSGGKETDYKLLMRNIRLRSYYGEFE